MKYKVFAVFIFLNLVLPHAGYTQSVCDNALYQADKLFEAGKFQECITTLQPCATSQKNKEYRMQSYRLIALAYLNLNNDVKAREYIKYMLKVKPDYQKYPNIDPVAFSHIVSEYNTTPKIYTGVKFGFNVNSVALQKSYSTYKSAQSYNPTTGYQLGITGTYNLKKGFGISADIFFSRIGITHVIENAGGWKQNYAEQQKYYNLNIMAVQQFALSKKINIYGGLGIGIGFMQNADVYLESQNIQTQAIQQSTRDAINERNKIQISGQAMIGFTYPLASGILTVDAGYAYYFKNTVNPAKRMDDLNFILNNQYINDDISFRLFSINVSYKMPLEWKTILK